ncbi:right-handed parallel beta-helix repeat-containing protein [Ginsengibacter hankyongi]|uniref:Right-handed parallel beta-helix repeat-containing protein n=1 Tax=Ginsengibacter hankyongi TaxID=2607284 RepID=A0A5J5IJX3_9BACT|nr:right-handed parallel beta-helix repeat-containing protein [Ginsengibacter hankyongi]KAA9038685.1 right-handed parallel beta-helix repeat-containing protein [Ginsengibacter hankyongi]
MGSTKIKFIIILSGILFSLLKYSEGNAQSRIKPEIWVNDIGANGTDTLNDTWAFQKAIDSMAGLGGGIVKVRSGNYYIDVDSSIKMKSNVELNMFDTSRKLIAIPTYSGKYRVILIQKADDVTIIGGKIIGEREKHSGPECAHKCEQGYGITIAGSRNVKVTDSFITECWGDGIVLYGASGVDCKNITLLRVTCSNNRRQGLSILNGDGIIVDSCAFLNTHGTAPQDGIDIEPDAGTTQNVIIKNCLISNNAGNGVEMNAKPTTSAIIKNITVQNNIIQYSKYAGYIQHSSNIKFNLNTFQNIKYASDLHASDCGSCTLAPNTEK